MRHRLWTHAMPALLVAAAGCNIVGSWRTVEIEPPGAPFPILMVNFDQGNEYTATRIQNGEPRTSTGRYEFNGSTLTVTEGNTMPRKYRVRRRLDGRLVLTYQEGDAKVTATLSKVDP